MSDPWQVESVRRIFKMADKATESDLRNGTFLGRIAESADGITETLVEVNAEIRKAEVWKDVYEGHLIKKGVSARLAAKLRREVVVDVDYDPKKYAQDTIDDMEGD